LALWEPLFILGLGHQWPVPPDALEQCGVCHGAELSAESLCLWCLRSSVDDLLPEVPASERPKLVVTPYRDDGLVGGRGLAGPLPKPPNPAPTIPGGWKLKPHAGPRARRSIHQPA
jgi:hypothetical protein